ncbi:uncharacterized protein LOC116174061 [Photinus pyralis]|uniref:uncharacterized protein LOC116174061 n=1 Tax=Photinus pyralis TaxID=7054 RepID=UPI0012672A7E|nr:uncharacterized protein LOC116174061 [Photinus pyralis]
MFPTETKDCYFTIVNEQGKKSEREIGEEKSEIVKWLENNVSPWTSVINHWTETFHTRRNLFLELPDLCGYKDNFCQTAHNLAASASFVYYRIITLLAAAAKIICLESKEIQ